MARLKPKAVIFFRQPASVLDKDAPLPPMSIYAAGLPILGILLRRAGDGPSVGRQGRGRAQSRISGVPSSRS